MAGCKDFTPVSVSSRAGQRAERGWRVSRLPSIPGLRHTGATPEKAACRPVSTGPVRENVKSVDVRWPAPQPLRGCGRRVLRAITRPCCCRVVVEAGGSHKPSSIASISIEYGICKDICIPAQADSAATLGAPPTSHAEIESVLRTKVPRKQAIGATRDLVRALECQAPRTTKASFTRSFRRPPAQTPTSSSKHPTAGISRPPPPDDRQPRCRHLRREAGGRRPFPMSVTLTLVAGAKVRREHSRARRHGKPR